jgi:RNA polymerase sigma-70 factor (ECF subfamily)
MNAPVKALGAERGRDFERMYAALAPQLRSWVGSHLRPRVRVRLDEEDVVQEVWARAARAWSSYDPRRGTLRRWLERLARRTLLDLLRAERANPVHLEGEQRLADPSGRPEEAHDALALELVRQEILGRFLVELEALPRDDRELVLICGLDGRPTTDAARELAISGAAARKRWLRLRRRLARRTDLSALVD